MEWSTFEEAVPESKVVLMIRVGSSTFYAVKKGLMILRIKEIRSKDCNCVTDHKLVRQELSSINFWKYPPSPEKMNIIYEDLLL